MKIAVVGLGYVGLPLSLQFARSGAQVLGLDVDASKDRGPVSGEELHQAHRFVSIAELLEAGRFTASIEFSRVQEVEAIIICVPTPLNKNREPDISYILKTGEAIGPFLRTGQLGRSGVHDLSRHDGRRFACGAGGRLRAEGGHRFSSRVLSRARRPRQSRQPSRLDSQSHRWTDSGLPGAREGALRQGDHDTWFRFPPAAAAEATKLLENIFRSVNIASGE